MNINNAVFNDDDSEGSDNDPDFVLDNGSPSESDEERRGKRKATAFVVDDAAPENEAHEEAVRIAQKAARASLWESFQSSVRHGGTGSGIRNETGTKLGSGTVGQRKLAKVEKKYRFAGEIITEVVDVPEDSDDARKWPLWKAQVAKDEKTRIEVPSLGAPETSVSTSTSMSASTVSTSAAALDTLSKAPTASASASSGSASAPAPPVPGRARPGPRKPKTSLMALPAQTKPKKLSTLEKSAMDWRAHVSGSGGGDTDGAEASAAAAAETLADELERNRRGGGYLEKVAFLDRVGERREELYEEGRKKRRKG